MFKIKECTERRREKGAETESELCVCVCVCVYVWGRAGGGGVVVYLGPCQARPRRLEDRTGVGGWVWEE